MNNGVRNGIKIGGVAPVRFVDFELVREIQLDFTCAIGSVENGHAAHEDGPLVVDDVFKRELDLEPCVLRRDIARERFFFAADRDFPATVPQPAKKPVDPYANAMNVMPAHVIFVSHMRVIQITHQAILIECDRKFAVSENDGAGHIYRAAGNALDVPTRNCKSESAFM